MWRRFSRSELLSTFFPSWIWQGRQWSKGKVPKYDSHFWLNAHAHPVVCTYYPPSAIVSWLVTSLSLDMQFRILMLLLAGHCFVGLVGWYFLIHSFAPFLIAIFGAITFTLSAYNWKQQPCFIYTVAWFPWVLTGIATHNILLTSVAFGMVLLAGYYPIGIQIALVAGCATVLWNCPPTWIPIGVFIGLPQLIPFIKYLPKTIRANKHDDIGMVPWWHPVSLLVPKLLRHNLNGVGYWEMAYYVGIVPLGLLAFSSSSWALIIGVVSYFLMMGVGRRFFPRIPARWCFSFQFALGWCAVSGLINLHLTERVLAGLCLIQFFDLIWHNADLIPTSPYSELYNKPSRAFNTRLTRYLKGVKGRVSGLPYPLFTGHINELLTLGYSGGMQLRLMAKWRMDRNPNGSGGHDFFRDNVDGECLDRARVEYAYTPAKINWEPTEIPRLYRNPRLKPS